jgi:RNA polymerase sigma-70 factor, ECF subfamily
MLDWQSLGTYTKIGSYPFGRITRLMSDESTEIERLNTLDPQAITALHNRYYPEVYRFARFRVSDERLAEDIASEVFIRLLESVHRGNGPESNLRGWLIRTTSNMVNDHFRSVYRHPPEESTDIFDSNADLFAAQSDPVIVHDQAEKLRSLQAAIERLTDAQKLVITLRFGNHYSLEETARLMGKDPNSIKALQFRAVTTLRRILGSETL